ncbi:response regulator receiver sensor signal transduction histidine kinase [Thalassoporum mexicanum PCC 7367]|uniref:hybrid sensor histidine kinase/response regulator n=1 Tax=Thalassoporum mexicanum TaxID=3457544 RepID=UPI00029FF451|nr:response regulator [Pseudanabaena sp. PCC 7367]AFY69005.1 response regulator receiver sensor signal transduction histidine kinase [Pseudanabaena sp. PCC 7367]
MVKVLVIEDMESLREEIMETLACEDFEVIGADNGTLGVELAREHLPDLIVCDVMMPGLDGFDTLKAIRQEDLTAVIPFIFLTAKSDKGDLRQGMELGADDYITKPFATAELLSAINTRLAKQAVINTKAKTELDALRNSISMSLPHELRTPLNGIMGFSEMLLEALNSEQQPDLIMIVQNIKDSAQLLYRVIQNFLLYAELELAATNGNDGIEQEQAIAATYGTDVILEIAGKKAAEYGRNSDLRLQINEAPLMMPPAKLSKIVEELVDNALKYSETGSPIEVLGETKDGFYWLEISDRGRGMTVAQIQQVGAYMQFERKLYEQQGSGLGLAIARRLSELYGGSLTLNSTPDQKTTVQVKLPLFVDKD